MARWRDWDDDDPGMVHDPEDEDWPDDWDDEPTIPCPHCRREILEDAERCPYCERYLSKEDAPGRASPGGSSSASSRASTSSIDGTPGGEPDSPRTGRCRTPTLEVTMSTTLVDQYRRWFEYEKDSHRKVLESLETVPEDGRASEPYRKALNLMGHLVAARRIWLHRLDPTFERPAAIFPTGVAREGLPADFEAMERDWADYLGPLTDADLRARLHLPTTEGDWYRTGLADVLTQLYGHSHYHRGQIASLVRAAGGQPARTDFIFWVREPAEPPASS